MIVSRFPESTSFYQLEILFGKVVDALGVMLGILIGAKEECKFFWRFGFICCVYMLMASVMFLIWMVLLIEFAHLTRSLQAPSFTPTNNI